MLSEWINYVWRDVLAWSLVLLHTLIIISVSLRVIMKRREIGISLSWLAIIYALPFAGVGFYFLFGELNLGKKRAQRATHMFSPFKLAIETFRENQSARALEVSDTAKPMHDLIEGLLGMPSIAGNHLTLLDTTDTILLELIEQVNQAEHSCMMEFYIWHLGGFSDQLADALGNAAKRGVDCKLLLDSVGSRAFFDSELPDELRAAGVQLVEVLKSGPLRMFFQRQDLRMHRKLVCIDERIAYTGSMNIVDPRFFKQDAGLGEWIDVMVRVQGPAVALITSLLQWDWEMETGERLLTPFGTQDTLHGGCGDRVQLIPSGPFPGGDCIHQLLLTCVYQAKHSLVLTTPYFVPDDSLHKALQAAAHRGVQVKIILPALNDSLMVKYAASAFYDELLAAGVEIYKFHGGLLHTKSIVVDEVVALVGTVNLDRRSFWLNFEVTMLVDDAEFAGRVLNLQLQYMLASEKLTLNQWRQRSRIRRFWENVFYLFSPIL
ncbi:MULTISPECIES: cardiolipin synthase [unclassified Motilimonas]|uniref:cardiolipin synthase n=1 Tax=Motilimonas TaxID=1914248 RepID=UPI001E312907|nr:MULTISPECIES: cardiolipin synthase [unclassified Motilimonas]MCE0556178.1 cardiolipin synthase [Motilimonas sp. E26]MDO6524924.1 cardiolipin synthase [Motilimonas sp. 1_MG-2023]